MRNVDIPIKTHQLYNYSSQIERSNSASGEKNSATLKRKSASSLPKTQNSSQKKRDSKGANFQPTLKDVYLFDRELSEFESEEKRIQEELAETLSGVKTHPKNQNIVPPDNSPKTTVSVDAIEDDIFILVNEIERLNSIINQDRAELQIYKDKYSQLQQNLFALGLDEEQLGLAIKDALTTENYGENFSTFRKESPKNLLSSEEAKKIKEELESWKTKYLELEKTRANHQNSESTESNIYFREQKNTIRTLERKLEVVTNENAQLKTFIESYNFETKNQQVQQGKEVHKSVDLLILQRNRLEVALEEKNKEADEWKQKFYEVKMATSSEGENSTDVMKYLTAENQKLSELIRQTQKDLETLKLKAPELKEHHKLNEELRATMDEMILDQRNSKHFLSPVNHDPEDFIAQDQMLTLTRTASKFRTPNLSVVEEKLEITGQASVEINTSVLLKDIDIDESDKKPDLVLLIPTDHPEEKISSEDPGQRILEIEKKLYLEQKENRQLKDALEVKNQETKKLHETKIDLDKLRLENRKIIDKYKALRLEKKMLEALILELRNQVKILSQELNNVTKDQSKNDERGSSKIESLSSENQRLNKLFMEKLVEIQKLNDRINEYEQFKTAKLEELQQKDHLIEKLKLKLSAPETQDGHTESIENKIFVLVEEIEKLNAVINEQSQLLEAFQNNAFLRGDNTENHDET